MADERIRATEGQVTSTTTRTATKGQRKGVATTETKTNRPTEVHEPKDSFREIVETVVFVIVLVLMLKTFIAEAFVIPTGSMATTLLGYHLNVECPKCGHNFTVNRSREAESGIPIIGCTCPNCRYSIPLSQGGPPQNQEWR